MGKLFFIIFIILFFVSCSSAQTWKKVYYDSNDVYPYLNITDIDLKYDSINDQYIFLGNSHSYEGWSSVYKLSNNGDLLFRNYFSNHGGSGQSLKFTNDSGIIISDLAAYHEVFKLDTGYNIVWQKQYEYSINGDVQVSLKETSDHKIILSGTTYYVISHYGHVYPYILKTDSVGNMLWFKLYSRSEADQKFITQTLDGNYIIGASSDYNEGVELIKTDTAGSIIWSKSYFRPNGYVFDISEKQNGHLIVIGNKDTTSQTLPLMFMMELDAGGSVVWCKTYGDSSIRIANGTTSYPFPDPMKLKPTSDGGYIITAGIITPSRPQTDLVLIKTDSVGNIQWERRHGGYESAETGINLIQTPDKGYFVVGSFGINGSLEEGYYILKTDSLGFTGCEEFSDSIPQTIINPNDSNIFVVDSAIVIVVDTGMASAGTDTPPTVDDGCLLDGITEISNNENGLLLYPNPTSGKFHLNVSNDDFKDKDILIYDVLGKTILERKHITDSTFDFDLSNEPKGVYFLKVPSDTKRSTVKVVVL